MADTIQKRIEQTDTDVLKVQFESLNYNIEELKQYGMQDLKLREKMAEELEERGVDIEELQ